MFESIKIYKDEDIRYDELAKTLIDYGYQRAGRISEPGDFSMRGGIIDIFPPTFDGPLRVELLGTKVGSIKSFSILSNETLEEHAMVIILPKIGLYPKRRKIKQFEASLKSPLESFIDIKVNDHIVHLDHGIGVFKGFEEIDFHGEKKDHIVIEYKNKDKLYVPIEEMNLIQKYVAFEKRPPKLSKLGGRFWQRTKDKVKEGVYSFAFDLLELNAKRAKLEGFSFSKDTDWQAQFEKEFPYKETPDQVRSCIDAKKDMESKKPMDRLLCGDVGYGKTEVALRAIFKAVMDNKQVAMLVPTTILAEQHFITFKDRMKAFPVRVELVCRFRTRTEVSRILEDIEKGSVDIVIGTHAILRNDIRFKDLGLVVIDEEQRFGVKDKEKLKKMRMLVDVLTLTATPIPRTLYMSLMDIKDMSIIETPPQNRLPIEIIISNHDHGLIKKAISYEKNRGGQVFFIHNRIEGIEKIAEDISRMVPKAKVAIAHGRMKAHELEKVMSEFMKGTIDVLVCTVIIESGIDIPNANTLIVNRADRFGLADLYQLKGRVGRFDKKAYAYFLIPKDRVMSKDSERRLRAIEHYKDLGSGFKIAMEDLEIRGAGNLLGTEQHGYISAVGFDLYCRMIRETVKTLKQKDIN
ncbi:MAG: transcription-repair coupling factor [Candidatus Omnitrophota bacterium]